MEKELLSSILGDSAAALGLGGKVVPEGLLKNEDGESILKYCLYTLCTKGYEEIVRREVGGVGVGVLDAVSFNPSKSSALHGAAFWGHSGIVKLLVDAGCNVTLANETGEYAIDNALRPSLTATWQDPDTQYLSSIKTILPHLPPTFLTTYFTKDLLISTTTVTPGGVEDLGITAVTTLVEHMASCGVKVDMSPADVDACKKHLSAMQTLEAQELWTKLGSIISS